jgi:hypothetical protein
MDLLKNPLLLDWKIAQSRLSPGSKPQRDSDLVILRLVTALVTAKVTFAVLNARNSLIGGIET